MLTTKKIYKVYPQEPKQAKSELLHVLSIELELNQKEEAKQTQKELAKVDKKLKNVFVSNYA